MTLPKHAELWLPGYLRDRSRALLPRPRAKRLWVAMTDHFEPFGGKASTTQATQRVYAWQARWPRIAGAAPRDQAGKPPCFTFFYPQEEYTPEILRRIGAICRDGIADVEVHIHHQNDTAESFREKIHSFCKRLHNEHGFLRRRGDQIAFGFIHGNWALDNSYPDGRMCGVTGELQVLRDLGCYADFTMPSLPVLTQGRIINQIFWTNGDPKKPRGFDTGTEARPDGGRQGDLLMITGPVGLRYRDRWMPRLETGELACYDLPTPYRVKRWLDLAPRVGEDIFLKLYGHSAREDNAAALLGDDARSGALEAMFRWIAEAAVERELELHWASAYEMACAVEQVTKASPVPELIGAQ